MLKRSRALRSGGIISTKVDMETKLQNSTNVHSERFTPPDAKPVLSAAKSVWLVGCEESQAVTIELRKFGIEAFSCDTEPCSGGFPEYHLQMDVFDAIKLMKPKVGIFFPPCTYLTVSANRHLVNNPDRWQKMVDALKFVHTLMNSDIEHIAIENPIGLISTYIRKPDQIVSPHYFGDKVKKQTCLWLKNLPKLKYVQNDNLFEMKTLVEPDYVIYNSKKSKSGKSKYSISGTKPTTGNNEENRKFRSKTFPGVARAIAEQWTVALGCR